VEGVKPKNSNTRSVFIVLIVAILLLIGATVFLFVKSGKLENQLNQNIETKDSATIVAISKTIETTKTSEKNSEATVVAGNSVENIENFEFIKSALYREAIIPSWTSSGCAYAVTTSATDHQLVEIRETHNASCGGDPNTSPRIETFRLTDGKVEWLDTRDGGFYSLTDYRHYLSL